MYSFLRSSGIMFGDLFRAQSYEILRKSYTTNLLLKVEGIADVILVLRQLREKSSIFSLATFTLLIPPQDGFTPRAQLTVASFFFYLPLDLQRKKKNTYRL